MVQLPSSPDFLIAYYAAARLGAVLSTLHMPYGPVEAEPLLRHARARAVICGFGVGGYTLAISGLAAMVGATTEG